MRPARGSILLYLALGLAILVVLSGLAYKIRESGKDAVRLEWQEANTQERERLDRERTVRNTITEKREAQDATAYADLDARYRAALIGLRDQPRPDGKAPPLSSAASVVACPDRQADIAAGLERLEAGVLGLLERGDKAILRSAAGKAWLDEQLIVKVR